MDSWRDLLGYLPEKRLVEALDDDGDGLVDEAAWQSVMASSEERVRVTLGAELPAVHHSLGVYARKIFALSLLYTRRGITGSDNPFETIASEVEERLRSIAAGDESTDAATTEPVIIGEPAKIAGTAGLLA